MRGNTHLTKIVLAAEDSVATTTNIVMVLPVLNYISTRDLDIAFSTIPTVVMLKAQVFSQLDLSVGVKIAEVTEPVFS